MTLASQKPTDKMFMAMVIDLAQSEVYNNGLPFATIIVDSEDKIVADGGAAPRIPQKRVGPEMDHPQVIARIVLAVEGGPYLFEIESGIQVHRPVGGVHDRVEVFQAPNISSPFHLRSAQLLAQLHVGVGVRNDDAPAFGAQRRHVAQSLPDEIPVLGDQRRIVELIVEAQQIVVAELHALAEAA